MEAPTPPPLPGKPFWTPQPSPTASRKEFRPVRFQSPTLPRRYVVQQNSADVAAQPPWSTENALKLASPPMSTNSCSNLSTPTSPREGSEYTDYSSANFGEHKPSSSVSDKIKSNII